MMIAKALAIAILFGAGAHMMQRRDAFKLTAGSLLVSNAAVLLLVSSGLGSSEAALLPVDRLEDVPDPVVQALALTAIVIGFATTVLLLRITMAVERTHDTLDMSELVEAEIEAGEDAASEEEG